MKTLSSDSDHAHRGRHGHGARAAALALVEQLPTPLTLQDRGRAGDVVDMVPPDMGKVDPWPSD